MAHIGRPPYTEAQIAAMTSKEEKLRAIAEYQSYNLRLKREVEAQAARGNGLDAEQVRSGTAPSRKPYEPSPTTKRGGYASGVRGRGLYHPYQRPQAHFKNKTAVFSQSETESSDTNNASTRPLSNKSSKAIRQQQTEPASLCPALTSTGKCTRHACHYHHDPNKQAICKRWLYKNDCPKGEFCLLSHTATPENVPTCLHFQDGRCNNDNCRFAHIDVKPAALNCDAFGRLGYCEKGDKCAELHAYECPTFANTGECPYGDICRWGHVRRASRMRQATRPPPEVSDKPEDDQDTAKEDFILQADFVPLDVDD